MKLICMLLFTMSTIFTGTTEEKIDIDQETKSVIATYIGNKDHYSVFETDGNKMAFHKVSKKITKTIDFLDSKLIGKSFLIEYSEEDAKTEEGESFTFRTIISIEPATTE